MNPALNVFLALPLVVGPVLTSEAVSLRHAVPASKATELGALRDPKLEALRAGKIVAKPAPFEQEQRTTLRVAQDQCPDLAEMRAGGGTGLLLAVLVIALIVILV